MGKWGLKGHVHQALDTLEIKAREISIAIADWLSTESPYTPLFNTKTQTRSEGDREISDGEGKGEIDFFSRGVGRRACHVFMGGGWSQDGFQPPPKGVRV